MKHIRHLAAAGAAALLAAGGPAAIAADVKVGSAAGITGPIEGLVPPILAGRNLAATHVNEQGGILGGGTYMLVPGDSQCNPKAAVDAGTKLVNVEQVVAVIGPSCSGATNGMAQSVTIPAGVVTLSDSATAPMISFLEDGDLVFRAAPSDGYQSSALARFAWDAGLRKIAVTYANDDYNAGLGEAFVAAFEQIGGTITGKQATNRTGSRTAPSSPPLPEEARTRSRSSPTSEGAESRSCATASRTPSSTGSSGPTA